MKDILINEKEGMRLSAQHGEVFLQRVAHAPARRAQKVKQFIVGHSESGHNHILESTTDFEVLAGDDKHDLYLRLFAPAKLVHKKSFDIHETQVIVPGDYAVYQKTEYDLFAEVRRAVFD